MEKFGCSQTPPSILRKEKKKKAKDEMDRLKQAEKKKRRLEKALATSAAIRSELEKKKQKKKEEQQRLDEEGAAIAESVALHVLGGEDSDDTAQLTQNRSKRYDYTDGSKSIGFFVDYQGFKRSTFEGLGWVWDAYGSGFKWDNCGIGYPLPSEVHGSNLQLPFFEESGQVAELSPGFLAAEAFSALQIAESSYEHPFSGGGTETVIFDRIIGSNNLGNEINFYEEY